jgi:hypothetical protein
MLTLAPGIFQASAWMHETGLSYKPDVPPIELPCDKDIAEYTLTMQKDRTV